MTILSFRADAAQEAQVQVWADRLGIDRSELLRDALNRELSRLAGGVGAGSWEGKPVHEQEGVVAARGSCGPPEDWSDWADVSR